MAKIGLWHSVRASGGAPRSHHDLSPAEASSILQAYEESRQGWFWVTGVDGCLTYITNQVVPLITRQTDDINGTPLADLFVSRREFDRKPQFAFRDD